MNNFSVTGYICKVLILVLMENTLRARRWAASEGACISLNPCSNGKYSQSVGKWANNVMNIKVLILVLMEDTLRDYKSYARYVVECLNPCFNGRYSQRTNLFNYLKLKIVLILVLMEDTLRGVASFTKNSSSTSLNPCFNGRYSQRNQNIRIWKKM